MMGTSVSERIEAILQRRFEDDGHRIVLWVDKDGSCRESFDEVNLPDVGKVEWAGNAFGLKYHMLREKPDTRFLVYHAGPLPEDRDNWLLDVQLAYTVFGADTLALLLDELGLPSSCRSVLEEYAAFFNSKERIAALKKLGTGQDDTPDSLRMKLLAACTRVRSDHIKDITLELLTEYSQSRNNHLEEITRFGLDTFLWQAWQKAWAYQAENPSVEDFAMALFLSAHDRSLGEHVSGSQPGLNIDACTLLEQMKDSSNFSEVYETLAEKFEGDLQIASRIESLSWQELEDSDIFPCIDRHIIRKLSEGVLGRTEQMKRVSDVAQKRSKSRWGKQYQDAYAALDAAARFFSAHASAKFSMSSVEDGIERYCSQWYVLDQSYRLFITAWQKLASEQREWLDKLDEKVEGFYARQVLYPLGDQFSDKVALLEKSGRWQTDKFLLQRNFYDRRIKPLTDKGQRAVVVISDALRYEVAESLCQRVHTINRVKAKLEPMLGMLPSYTQLGMAALLPNNTLEITPDDSASVTVDGMSSIGTENRSKILGKASPDAIALSIKDLKNQSRDELRAFVQKHNPIYIYHDQIDAIGDKQATEEGVFDAVEKTISELEKLVRQLDGANVGRIFVTADHGFLYQHGATDQSDYSLASPSGAKLSRRYVIGKNLVPEKGLHTFEPGQLGLGGDMMVQVPKGVSRLRVKGAGSRFVHGGATLQEIVVPLLDIRIAKTNDVVGDIEFGINPPKSNVIAQESFTVTLVQKEPVSAKRRAVELRVGFYRKSDNVLVSSQRRVILDSQSTATREHEYRVQLSFTDAVANIPKLEVVLRIEKRLSESTWQFCDEEMMFTKHRAGISKDF